MKSKDNKEVKHLLATIGSLTGRAGRVTAAKGRFALPDLGVARVGDKRIPRLFDPACMPPQCTTADRGHNHA